MTPQYNEYSIIIIGFFQSIHRSLIEAKQVNVFNCESIIYLILNIVYNYVGIYEPVGGIHGDLTNDD